MNAALSIIPVKHITRSSNPHSPSEFLSLRAPSPTLQYRIADKNMPKRTLRAAMLARRRGLTPQQVASQSLALQQRFLELAEFRRSKVLALYAPIHHEVETVAVAQAALSAGKMLLYPAVEGDDLRFSRVASLDELSPGKFGIPEPEGEPCDPAGADLIVIPGVAFDLYGRRIGYGKGYYDRALHRLEESGKLVAFCFDFQLVQEIVGEPHDVTMDLIVTESRVVRVNNHIREGEQR